jgi:hypothetical protein
VQQAKNLLPAVVLDAHARAQWRERAQREPVTRFVSQRFPWTDMDAGGQNVKDYMRLALSTDVYRCPACALARRRCSSSRGMISTKLHGR